MRSLRARLLVILLVLTAIGLLTAGAITYAEQRSFLYDRVDRQVRSSQEAVARALGGQDFARRGGVQGAPPGLGAGGRPPGPDQDFGPPPGTYGEVRDADGQVLDSVTLGYGDDATTTPDLPDDLPIGKLFTVDATDGNGPRYRVQATQQPDGSVFVVAIPLADEDQALDQLLVVEGIVIAAVLLALAVIGWIVVRVGLLPLDRMGHTANRIAGGDLSARVDTTDARTEVGRLGIALNAMLERLEAAFAQRQASEDRLRQFLADASHELRTPLASIRGYAELYRMGALRDDAETERAMSRVEDEAARMGVLVEDLLTLARLDEVAEAPHVELDLAQLASDAVDDARATAPEREIGLHVEGAVLVRGDAHQLRQVLANLLRNALVHTPAGTPIDVFVGQRGDIAELIVRDHGPGLPEGEADALFERFWRSEGGRERGRAGAGLGLAIVAAIVAAHGGRVSAADAPDGGAAFTVALPPSAQRVPHGGATSST
jgi:two-component system OmpR family sensor kinase